MAKKKIEKIEAVESIEEKLPVPEIKVDEYKKECEIELARLRKLHQDQVELGINPDAKLEVLIEQLVMKISKL